MPHNCTNPLPDLSATANDAVDERDAPGNGAAARRILVVDDNCDAAQMMAWFLEFNAHETQIAHDGIEAVEAAEMFRPDVVLLDIGLPKLNGHDACRKIREEPWGKGMVLIALTGCGEDEDRRKSQEAGFDHHLVKPVDLADLTKLLAELLPTPAC